MATESTTYYINENENIFEFFASLNIELSSAISKQIAFISNKTSNNYIGFYQFLHENKYAKFYVMPKIYKDDLESDKERLFIEFLSKYYTLKNKYSDIKKESVKDNTRDIALEGDTKQESDTINTFIEQKYLSALKTLDVFFRKYNKKRKISTHYTSQTLEHKLNLRRNISSVNKATIHQIKEIEEAYSKIAHITQEALNNFKKEKLQTITNNEVLSNTTNSILNTIRKKFRTQGNETFKDKYIIRHKIAKLFRKTNELQDVYEALLIIIGLEHFKSDKQSSEVIKMSNMTALFFRPEELYEWLVYDKLLHDESLSDANILRQNECETKYHLRTEEKVLREVTSKPDFIIEQENSITVVDAKWKIVDGISDIKFDDIAKLERDYTLRKKELERNGNLEKLEIKAKLIYPKIKDTFNDRENLFNDYKPDFQFDIRQVEV